MPKSIKRFYRNTGKNIAENDVSEIVIVDLNQLENQLNESETVE